MSLQPSASRSSLILECSYPFTPGLEFERDTAGEPARYGSSFHEILAALILKNGKIESGKFSKLVEKSVKKYKIPPSSAKNLPGHVRGSYQVLKKWLEGSNLWAKNFFDGEVLEVEKSFGFKFGQGYAVEMREVSPPTVDDHRYEDLEEKELAATNDLILGGLVIDHKTGSAETFHLPAEKPQLRTLGLIPFSRGRKDIILGVLHADRMGLPIVYADEISQEEMASHAKKMEVALSRVNDGSMRPGPWCSQCPAREACPAQHGELLKRSSEIVQRSMSLPQFLEGDDGSREVMAPSRIGEVHLLLSKLDALMKVGRAELKTWVKEHPSELAQRPDGKVLEIVIRNYESLSKASILEALGKIKGERELTRLRKLGAMRADTREELHAVRGD